MTRKSSGFTNWYIVPFDDSDKNITIMAGDIAISVDHDDCDLNEAENIANFISGVSNQYNQWKIQHA